MSSVSRQGRDGMEWKVWLADKILGIDTAGCSEAQLILQTLAQVYGTIYLINDRQK